MGNMPHAKITALYPEREAGAESISATRPVAAAYLDDAVHQLPAAKSGVGKDVLVAHGLDRGHGRRAGNGVGDVRATHRAGRLQPTNVTRNAMRERAGDRLSFGARMCMYVLRMYTCVCTAMRKILR